MDPEKITVQSLYPLDIPTVATFELGDWPLQSGEVLRDARLVYASYGKLAPNRKNVVLYPTHYTGDHSSNATMVGTKRVLDPTRYFIVIPNLFGNGVSTSPSNAHPSQRQDKFPRVSVYDNVKAQYRLLQDLWGIDRLAAVYGWSMGGQQAYHWAVLFPEMVERLICCCGSARTSMHNRVFLEGVKAALCADRLFSPDGPSPERGLKAFGRVYAGWAYSQAFYREKRYRDLGFDSVEELLQWWERDHLSWNAHDLLAMLRTWQYADVSANDQFNGDLRAALKNIRARTLLLPGNSDLYFHPRDNHLELAHLHRGRCVEIPSSWGHMAGSPGRGGVDRAFIERQMKKELNS